jgi:uncharacterized protein (TIGR03382 family)
VVFNGDIQLTGGASPPSSPNWRFQVGQGNDGVTSGVVIGKMVFNGNILQTGAGSYSLTNANGSTGSPSIVQFYGHNTYTGGTTVSAPDGSTAANANIGIGSSSIGGVGSITSGPLGTGTFTVTGASSVEALGSARTVDNAINLSLIQSNLIVRGSNDLTLNAALSGFGGLTMNGGTSNKLTLGGASTYANATNVNSGTLLVNGSIIGTNGVTVASGATLGGTGSVGGVSAPAPISNSGTIAPGTADSVGSLSVTGDVSDQGASSWAIDLSGTSSDLLAVTGNITLSGSDTVSVSGAGTGASWIIATYTGSLTGTFGSVTGGAYSLDYSTLGQIILRTPGSGARNGAVPEPATILLGAFALGFVAIWRRRK